MFGLVASRWWLAHLPYNSHLGQLVDTSLPPGIIKQHNLWLLAEKVTASLLLPLDLCLSHLRADGIESIASAQYLYRRLLFCLCSIGRRWLFVLVVSALRSSTKLCTSSLGSMKWWPSASSCLISHPGQLSLAIPPQMDIVGAWDRRPIVKKTARSRCSESRESCTQLD